jgi:hypothetical protein
MKTRVIRTFSVRLGMDLYYVEKWAEWDDPELRSYYPGQMDWRIACDPRPDWEWVRSYAERLSKGNAPKFDVVAEFGE